ncbi:MAG: RDD family protein [Desulfobacterales bacterium]|nr:RDD family protein [Desulfobacterales bacterium]
MFFKKTNIIKIRTPEAISFDIHLASPIVRCLAWIIDLLAIAVAFNILYSVIRSLSYINTDIAFSLLILGQFLILIGYSIFCEWFFKGQTIGKRLIGLKVIDAQNLNLRFEQIAIRNLMRPIDIFPICYMVGGICCLLNKKYQRFGDLIANTIVIWTKKLAPPDFNKVYSGKYNSLRAYPHLKNRLRHNITPKKAEIALETILRRDELEPESRVEIFNLIADNFRNTVKFPKEATEGLSDEQYVKNVVEILFKYD